MTQAHPPPDPRRLPPKPKPPDADTALAICRAAIMRARYTSYHQVYKKPPPFV